MTRRARVRKVITAVVVLAAPHVCIAQGENQDIEPHKKSISGDGWHLGDIGFSGYEKQLPVVASADGKYLLYSTRQTHDHTARMRILVPDNRCTGPGKPGIILDHFVKSGGQKFVMLSACHSKATRSMYPEGFALNTLFDGRESVKFEEVDPDPGWQPINIRFSTKNYEPVNREYNIRSARELGL